MNELKLKKNRIECECSSSLNLHILILTMTIECWMLVWPHDESNGIAFWSWLCLNAIFTYQNQSCLWQNVLMMIIIIMFGLGILSQSSSDSIFSLIRAIEPLCWDKVILSSVMPSKLSFWCCHLTPSILNLSSHHSHSVCYALIGCHFGDNIGLLELDTSDYWVWWSLKWMIQSRQQTSQ